jgi:DNA-directed RNA polymerase subunit RPC12/RpoP
MAVTDTFTAKCVECAFEIPAGGEAWDTAKHPPFGTIIRCPECGRTDVHNRF